MKKKLTLVVTCVVLVAAMVIGGTLAYFTDTKDATNTFTVGNLSSRGQRQLRRYLHSRPHPDRERHEVCH